MADAVFFATDDADLNLEHDPDCGHAGEKLLGDGEVLTERDRGSVPHVRLEERQAALAHTLLARGDEWQYKVLKVLLRAVVGVQGDGHIVGLRDLFCILCKCDGAADAVLHRLPGKVIGTAEAHLDDPVGARLGEALQGRVQCLRARNVDGGEGESSRLCGIEHRCILVRGCDGHVMSSLAS